MALLLASALALPAEAASRQSDEDACRPDVFRLCTGEIPDEAAIVRCLDRAARNLSPACAAVIAPEPRQPPGVARRSP